MKKIFLTLFLFFCVFNLFAQVAISPTHDFYSALEIWQNKKIVSNLPPLKPYPIYMVKNILEDVLSSDDEKEIQIAQNLYNEIFNKSFHANFEIFDYAKHSKEENNNLFFVKPGIFGDINLYQNLSFSYDFNIIAIHKYNNVKNLSTYDYVDQSIPVFSSLPYTFLDPAIVGPLKMFIEFEGGFTYEIKNFYVQAGINHLNFGSFYDDSIVLSPDAKHSANFSFVINKNRWNYTHGLFALCASNDKGIFFPDKFLILHSLNVKINKWLNASFYETIIYGNRFDFSYLLPVPFMSSQALSYYSDNLTMGMTFDVGVFKDWIWYTDFIIDDLGVNELLKLDFDAKIRGSLKTGVKFSPSNSMSKIVDLINLNYTIVTPYMYTHWQENKNVLTGENVFGNSNTANFQNFTNFGKSFASQLWPNTDQIKLQIAISPIQKLKIDFFTAFSRHANVNEDLTVDEAIEYLNAPKDAYVSDGSINNHQVVNGEYLHSANSRFMFLTQDTKMYITQIGFEAKYDLPKYKFGKITLNLGYSFEYIYNWGVQNNLFEGRAQKDGVAFEKDSSESATETDVQKAISEWKNKLTNICSHYFKFSVKYVY